MSVDILGRETIDSLQEIASAEQSLSNALLVDVNYCTLGARYSNAAIAPNLRTTDLPPITVPNET